MRRRRILAAMLAVSLGLLVRPVGVTPVFACSCAMDADPIATAARDPQQAVFTGIVQGPTAGGTPVVLTRWFGGPAPQPVVWLDNAGFEDPFGGMCGTARPPAGSEWIFGAYRTESGKLGVNMCSPHAALGTPEGQLMLASAVDVLGQPAVPLIEADPETASESMASALMLVVVGILAMVGLAAGIFLASSRRRT